LIDRLERHLQELSFFFAGTDIYFVIVAFENANNGNVIKKIKIVRSLTVQQSTAKTSIIQ
jgi:hypothetical protein